MNAQLQQRIAELQTLLDVMPVGIAVAADAECNRVRHVRHFLQGRMPTEEANFSPNLPIEARPAQYKLYRDGVEVPVEDLPMKVAAARGVEVLGEALDLVLGNGRVVPLCVDAAPLFDEQGRLRGSVAAIQDITERKRVEQELEGAKEVAESARRAKDQFLAMLSHELLTPLTPVLLTAAMMEEDPETPPHLRSAFAMIRRNVELEARLIDDLLDVTPILRGTVPYQFAVVDAHASIRHALEKSWCEIQARRQRVRLDLAATEHHVNADPARLQQLLWNLIKNAVKFSPVGGEIRINTRNREGRLIVAVADRGIGIEPEALPRIFDAFEPIGEPLT